MHSGSVNALVKDKQNRIKFELSESVYKRAKCEQALKTLPECMILRRSLDLKFQNFSGGHAPGPLQRTKPPQHENTRLSRSNIFITPGQ